MTETTVGQDMANWLAGDDAAFRRIFDHFYQRLYQTCYSITRNRENSEEMVMNVFVRIWKRRAAMKDVEDIEKYLFRCVRNQVADHHRKNILVTRDIDALPAEVLGSVDHPALRYKELLHIYEQALNKLPEKQRELFIMSREQGFSQQQIARKKNISVSTVNNQITAAMKIMRNDLGDYAEALPLLLLAAASSQL